MRTREEVLEAAERFVRAVLCEDFKQNPSEETIKQVAIKVTKAVPSRKKKEK